MVFLNVANAGGRYLLGKAIPGSDEILVFAMVWLVFLGACLVSLESRHLSLDILPRFLSAKGRRRLSAAIGLLTAILTGYVAIQSWAVLRKLQTVGQKSMATEIPMVVPHAAVTLSFTLIAVIAFFLVFRPSRTVDPQSGPPASDSP